MKPNSGKLASMTMLLVMLSGLVIWNHSGNSAAAAETFGPELIVNGDMEQAIPPVGWKSSGVTLSADTDSHSGRQSLKFVDSAEAPI